MESENFVKSSIVNVPAKTLGAWHHRRGALRRLTPPWVDFKMVEEPDKLEDGSQVVLKSKLAPFIWRKWISEIKDVKNGGDFTDVSIKGPFAEWRHQHRFIKKGTEKSQLNDSIHYRLPLGPVGKFFGGWHVRRELERMFRYRHQLTSMDIERQQEHPPEPMRILVSGATGLVGKALTAFLETSGHTVIALTRNPRPDSDDVRWDIAAGEIDLTAAGKVDAVVHLAGENPFGLWTKKKKARIMDSRREGTKLLSEAIARLPDPPSVLVSASGINFYELDALNPRDEDSPIGTSFLAEVCRAWEDNTRPAREADIRVVNLRIGLVLTPAGGGLRAMLPAFKAGGGGRISHGRQHVSWIAMDDLTDIIHHCITDDRYQGPVNAVAPQPITNKKFTKSLGRVLRRPTLFPVPAFVLKKLLGEFARESVLADLPVLPKRLRENGYEFRFSDLDKALIHLLGKPPQKESSAEE